MFGGYVVIGLTYWNLLEQYRSSKYVGIIALAITVIFFLATTFVGFQIQRRMHFTRFMQNLYLEKIRTAVTAEDVNPSALCRPRFLKWYVFLPQTILSAAA